MKKTITGILCIILVLLLSGCSMLDYALKGVAEVAGIIEGPDAADFGIEWDSERYSVYSLNSNQNLDKSNEWYIYWTPNGIYQYLIKEDRIEKLVVSNYIEQFRVEGETLYYSEQIGETTYLLKKKQLKTGEETTLLEGESLHLFFNISHGYLMYGRLNITSPQETYLCPLEGDPATDSIAVNDLFAKEDHSGEEQTIEYEGMLFKRSYDEKDSEYDISVIDKKTGGSLLYGNSSTNDKRAEIEYQGKQLTIVRNHDAAFTPEAFQYQMEGEDIWHPLTCYEDSDNTIFGKHLATDGDSIVGLIQEVTVFYNVPYNYQRDIKRELLFQLEPETGESSIIFQTENESTRIVGYEDGDIYLFSDYHVYKQSLASGETEELFTIPEVERYIFDWQGDYLIARYYEEELDYAVAIAYNVKNPAENSGELNENTHQLYHWKRK